jgi:hypothetical protein
MKNHRKLLKGVLLGLFLGGALGCGDILEVDDPQRFTSDDLDNALQAVADGVLGDLHFTFDDMVQFNALASDEMQHSGTWTQWDDFDHGRWAYDLSSPANSALLRVRWYARDAQDRFKRVYQEKSLGDPMKTKLMAQVMAVEAWSDLLNAEWFCEAPAEANGPALKDTDLMKIAVTEMTEAMAVAQAAGSSATDLYNWALAGRARANLWAGNYAAALADAKAVPEGYINYALYTITTGGAWMVVVATYGENKAGTIREKWWPLYDAATMRLKDPYTGQPDKRMEVRYTPGDKAVDGATAFYSQWKYKDRNADIPMTKKGEMDLIEAEVYWRQNDLTNAMAKLNKLRTQAGLTPHSTSPMPTSDKVFEYFMHEQFAELFLEGRRMSYLHRLNQVAPVFKAMKDPLRPVPRPTKWPIATAEARFNANIGENLSQRCLPMSGT